MFIVKSSLKQVGDSWGHC